MALRTGCRDPALQAWSEQELLDANRWTAEPCAAQAEEQECSVERALHDEQSSQNWGGQGESDCLIKTKHCDGLHRCLHNVISAQCSECQSDEIQISAGKRRE